MAPPVTLPPNQIDEQLDKIHTYSRSRLVSLNAIMPAYGTETLLAETSRKVLARALRGVAGGRASRRQDRSVSESP
jgi:hypothetical protein